MASMADRAHRTKKGHFSHQTWTWHVSGSVVQLLSCSVGHMQSLYCGCPTIKEGEMSSASVCLRVKRWDGGPMMLFLPHMF